MKQWKDKPMVLQGLLGYKLLKNLNPDHYLYLKEMVINDLNIPSTNQEQILTNLIIYLYFFNKRDPLLSCKEPYEKEKLQQLKIEIKDSHANNRAWLIRKTEEKLKGFTPPKNKL